MHPRLKKPYEQVKSRLPKVPDKKKRKKELEKRYDRLMERLPGEWAGAIDWRRPEFLNHWGGPLNGQLGRQQIVRDVVVGIGGFDQIVETGTWRGTTTEFFAHLTGKPVHTVEATDRAYAYARRRLGPYKHVRTNQGDARAFLRGLKHTSDARTFFYLDAHWYDDLPLAEELEIIFATWSSAAILIDDFEVPDQPRYRFDNYGPGMRLCADYVGELPKGWQMFYPSLPAVEETGARRGSALIVSPDLVPEVERVESLRPAAGVISVADKPDYEKRARKRV